MNPLFIPTLLLSLVLFFTGLEIARSLKSSSVFLIISMMAATPAILFAAYYTKTFGEAEWFYRFRSWPFTEFSAAGIGFLGGWFQYRREECPRIKKIVSAFFIPGLMLLCVTAPYLKQIFLRPDWSSFSDRWSEGVCLQSSESSCGPASAATLLHAFGKQATEYELAKESFTTRRGTENWYLLRTIRRHGVDANYLITLPGNDRIRHPAIAGVKLKDCPEAGHFIAILDGNNGRFIIGDPLNGREEVSRKQIAERYLFTGFYVLISNPVAAPPSSKK